MANELKITDVVDPKAITQLQSLKKEIDEAYTSYKDFVILLAQGIKDKPSTIQELSNKVANYNKAMAGLADAQNKVADLQERHNKLLEDYGNKISKLLTMNTLPKQFDDMTKAVNKLSGFLDDLFSKFQSTSTAQTSASQANQSYTASVQQTSQVIGLTTKQYAEIINNVMAYDQHAGELNKRLQENKISLQEIRRNLSLLAKDLQKGGLSYSDYIARTSELTIRERELITQNKQYSALLNNHASVVISPARLLTSTMP